MGGKRIGVRAASASSIEISFMFDGAQCRERLPLEPSPANLKRAEKHKAAIELARRQPQAICVSLHPGTVATRLSGPFSKSGLQVQTPAQCAERLLATIDGLREADSGGFFNHRGEALPW